MQSITIEQVEQLAEKIEADETAERNRLLRLIRAEARIAANRSPDAFERRALEISDEDGHWDNSYPPAIQHKEFRSAPLVRVREYSYEEIATSGGYYHDWRAATTDRGLYVAQDGALYGAEVEGTGKVGQFAAHPGNCGVMLTVSWDRLATDDLSLDDLRKVEQNLRALAFPVAASASASA